MINTNKKTICLSVCNIQLLIQMVFFKRTANTYFKISRVLHSWLPITLFYQSGFTRKIIYRSVYFVIACYAIGIFRRPYIAKKILLKEQAEKQQKVEAVQQILAKMEIQLNNYTENYFVIITGHCAAENEEQLNEKQKIAFELNNQINSRLEVNSNYYKDIKFLFIGDKNIYELLEQNKTIIVPYQKEREKSDVAAIYIFAKDIDGSQKFISSIPYKSDLSSIMRIISKHRARIFASSLQF